MCRGLSVENGHSPPLASSIELADSIHRERRDGVKCDRHAGALFPLFDIVETVVLHSHGDALFLSFNRNKYSSTVLGMALRFALTS